MKEKIFKILIYVVIVDSKAFYILLAAAAAFKFCYLNHKPPLNWCCVIGKWQALLLSLFMTRCVDMFQESIC